MASFPRNRGAYAARGSALDDERLWSKLERLLADRARRSAGRPHEDDDGIIRLEGESRRYRVRIAEVEGTTDPVVVAAIESAEPAWPTAVELGDRFGLTRREAEVAVRLAMRRTNREIAAEFVVSEHTARKHTERVFRKLGVHRRTDIARVLREGRHGRELALGAARIAVPA